MDFAQLLVIPPWIAGKGWQIVCTSPTEDVDGDLDNCSYKEERNKHVAKIKELIKPLEQTSIEMYVYLTSKSPILMLFVSQFVVMCVNCGHHECPEMLNV